MHGRRHRCQYICWLRMTCELVGGRPSPGRTIVGEIHVGLACRTGAPVVGGRAIVFLTRRREDARHRFHAMLVADAPVGKGHASFSDAKSCQTPEPIGKQTWQLLASPVGPIHRFGRPPGLAEFLLSLLAYTAYTAPSRLGNLSRLVDRSHRSQTRSYKLTRDEGELMVDNASRNRVVLR